MIIHSVVFKTKHPAGSAEEQAFLKAGLELAKLPMVEDFECFRQINDSCPFDFVFSMKFQTEEAFQAYNSHPDHCAFVENRWHNEVDSFMEIDYQAYAM